MSTGEPGLCRLCGRVLRDRDRSGHARRGNALTSLRLSCEVVEWC